MAGQPPADRPLVEACRPRTSLGCLFPEAEVASMRAWLASGVAGPALATATPGSGLTTLTTLLLREAGLESVWIGCATPKVKAALATAGSNPVSVTLRRKIIVIDEVDALGAGESGALADALAFVKSKPPVQVLFLSHVTRSQKTHEFAKSWPRFCMGRPSAPALKTYLHGIATKFGIAAVADEAWIAELVARVKGDVRSALMAMELVRRGGGAAREPPDVKDEVTEGLDLTEAVLKGERGHGVQECLKLFAMEPAVLPMGVWENYLTTLGKGDMEAVAAAADAFADADRVDRHMYSRQAWDVMDFYGACAVAGPAMGLRKLRKSKAPKTLAVTKFGSVWSKMYNACAKVKHVRALALAYAEAGAQPLSTCDLAWVRSCLQSALEHKSEPNDLARVCWPLSAPNVLHLARLHTGGSAWYTQACHARVKAALAAAAEGRS